MPVSTRAANADRHPGLTDHKARKTSMEVQAEKEVKAKVKQDKAESPEMSLARIAMLEDKMAAVDKKTERARKGGNRVKANVQSKAKQDPHPSSPLSTIVESLEVEEPPKKKKKVPSTREKIQKARQEHTTMDNDPEITPSDDEETEQNKGKGKKKVKGKGKAKANVLGPNGGDDFNDEMMDWAQKVPPGWKPSEDRLSARSTFTSASAAIKKTASSSNATASTRWTNSAAASLNKATSSTEAGSSKKRKSAPQAADTKCMKTKVNTGPSRDEFSVTEKSVLSDDEDAERLHALFSPIKPAQLRAVNSGAIDAMDVDPDDRASFTAGQSSRVHLKPTSMNELTVGTQLSAANPYFASANPDISVDATPGPRNTRLTINVSCLQLVVILLTNIELQTDVEIAEKQRMEEKTKKRKRKCKQVPELGSDSENEVNADLEDGGMELKAELHDAELGDANDDESDKHGKTIVKISDLPAIALQNERWCRRFLPTLLRFVGTLDTPWSMEETKFRKALELIWGKVYAKSGVEYMDEIHVVVCTLSIQRMCKWHSSFGSTAITIAEAFFNANIKYLDLTKCAAFATEMLKFRRFAYETAKGTIEGAVDVDRLCPKGSTLNVKSPIGALGLTGAAVERSLTLYKYFAIIYKNGKVTLKKRMCENVDAQSEPDAMKPTGFKKSGWIHETKCFTNSAVKFPR
ncbi:hypothetical protein BKA93DRAFT_746854 [Sparassis latifolia]